MAKINLLPWREEKRQERQKHFIALVIAIAVISGGLVFLANQGMNMMISGQEARNDFLRGEIRSLDRKITEIEDLESTRDSLISRKEVIERLQENRSLMVHLFNQIAQTVPEGITLNSLRQTGTELTIVGTTESESRVSDYMRRIESASWLHRPELRIVQARSGEQNSEQPFRFELRAQIGSPRLAEEEF